MFYYVNSQADMADADKQKEMDAKKAEVKYTYDHHDYDHHDHQYDDHHEHDLYQYDQVRARLEAQAAGKKNKKGFMTPERKKKLRVIIFGMVCRQ